MGKYLSQWDNTNVFANIEDPAIAQQLSQSEKNIDRLSNSGKELGNHKGNGDFIPWLTDISNLRKQDSLDLWELRVFANSESSKNAKNKKATELSHKTVNLFSKLSQAQVPFNQFFTSAEEEFIQKYLEYENNAVETEYISLLRKNKDFLLSQEAEQLLKEFEVEGKDSWKQLFKTLSGTTKAILEIDGKSTEINLAKAAALLSHPDEKQRKAAFYARDKAWQTHEHTSATMLNSLVSWKLKDWKRRCHTKERHFLDFALQVGKLEKQTLHAMMETLEERGKALGRKASLIRAKVFGKDKLDPWDVLAPHPTDTPVELSYDNCIDLITESCRKIGNEPADFVQLAAKSGWLDVDESQNRNPGGYCTSFLKKKQPRVFMNYKGQGKHAVTLAHELGHAYHTWVMRDLDFDEAHYPFTLAETASTFFETLFKESLENSDHIVGAQQLAAWENITAALAFLLDVPHRYSFEYEVFDRISKGETLSADQLCELMQQHSSKSFGESATGYDNRLWQNKIHYYMSERSFYNYPYTFGYLFSLAIYADQKKNPEGFLDRYKDLLIDSGRHSCEDIVEKHLGKNIQDKSFWHASLDIIEGQILRAEACLLPANQPSVTSSQMDDLHSP